MIFEELKWNKLRKCLEHLDRARRALAEGNVEDAKRMYMESREIYSKLEYYHRKEVYHELMDVYSRLKK